MSERTPRLLLVDDEPHIVKALKVRLEASGFAVLVALNGDEALTLAFAERPDLVILDLMLPTISGFEVCERLKRDPRSRDIPVIIYSGRGLVEEEERCRQLGAAAYVKKTDGSSSLLEHIRALLSHDGDSPRPS